MSEPLLPGADDGDDTIPAVVAPDPKGKGGKVVYLPPPPGAPAPDPAVQPFEPLGHDRDELFFMTTRGKQLLRIRASELSNKGRLLLLADLQFWQQGFAEGKGFTGQAVDRAVDWLIRVCYGRGPFRVDQLRGRGAWWDDGRLVVHVGDRLLVDGVSVKLADLKSRFVYEAQPPLALATEHPFGPGEAVTLYRYCTSLAWEVRVHGVLLAGWITCAIACGALRWRPHVFLTGPAASGKSTILDIITRLLGEFALSVKGDTSAAGIRQGLGPDALPVVFDEAEAEGPDGEAQMKRVLALLRASSSDVDSRVMKGGQAGEATSYVLRSMFLLAAIRVPMKQLADETRITVCALRKPKDWERARYVNETREYEVDLVQPEWAARLRARILGRVADLRENARVFGSAVAARLGSARLGDQLGPLCAGAFLLHEDGVVSAERARAWVERQPWEEQDVIAQESDEGKLLAALLEVSVTISVDRTRYDVSLGELVEIAAQARAHRMIAPTDAAGELGRHGMVVENGCLLISNTHRAIADRLAGTPWASGWSRILRRLEGAVCPNERPYFAGVRSRAVGVPLGAVLRPRGGARDG